MSGTLANGKVGGLALSPDEQKLYAAYWTDSSSEPIGVYSTSSYSLIEPVTMSYGTCHGGVAVSNDGRYIYTPSYYQGVLSRFDTYNSNSRTDLPAGEWPSWIYKSPDGTKLIAFSGKDGRPYDMGNDRIYVYDISNETFSTIGSIQMPDEPRVSGAFSNDGKYIYVPTYQRQSATARLYEVSIVGPLEINRYLEFSGNGLQDVAGNYDSLFVSDSVNQKIWMIDKATWSITDSIDLSFQPNRVVLHPDGQNLFVAGDGIISVFDITTKSLKSSLTNIPSVINNIVLTQDGSLAYVSYVSGDIGGGIAIISVSEPAIAATVDIDPDTLNLQSKGKWITCYISFPVDVNVEDVNSNTVLLNGTIKADWTWVDEEVQVIMAKFSRSAVQAMLQPGLVELSVSGKLNNGTGFQGKDTITVINQGNPCTKCPAGMVWVYINDPGVSGHEGFTGEMSKYETTNSQYCQFLNAALAFGDITVSGNNVLGASGSNSGEDFVGQVYYNLAGPGYTDYGATNGGATRIHYSGGVFSVDSGFENHPVTYVSWYGATAFCNYYGYRLPTEWEWQAVDDFNGSYTYGCGTSINNSIANYVDSIHPDGTTIVGAFGTYGYGLCDMAGNVWEWTSSLWDSPQYALRGGCWSYPDYGCSVSFRYNCVPGYESFGFGFRVCR